MINLLGLQLSKFYRRQRLQQALKVILGLILCLGTILMPAAIASAAGDINSGSKAGMISNPRRDRRA